MGVAIYADEERNGHMRRGRSPNSEQPPSSRIGFGRSEKKIMAKARTTSNRKTRAARRPASMVFERRNYLLLILGIALIVIGYAIMRMENEMDGIISLYVAPIVLLAGYLEIIYAILWRPADPAGSQTDQS